VPAFPNDKTLEGAYRWVLAEAMAYGVPIVGPDSGTIPEVTGSAGLVVPENNSERLAEALSLALYNADTRERLRQEGFARVEKELSCKAMATKLFGFYSRVLET
jgi:glycosyltransferase involved in cell wall biosynthesis